MDCKQVKQYFRQMETKHFQQMPEIAQHLANCEVCRSLTNRVVSTLGWQPVVPPIPLAFEKRLAQRLLEKKTDQKIVRLERIWGPVAIAASIALGIAIGSQTYNKMLTGSNTETILSANYQEMVPQTGYQLTDLLNEPEE